eukprot:3765804-Pleurochrysis_carterae.AAC.1
MARQSSPLQPRLALRAPTLPVRAPALGVDPSTRLKIRVRLARGARPGACPNVSLPTLATLRLLLLDRESRGILYVAAERHVRSQCLRVCRTCRMPPHSPRGASHARACDAPAGRARATCARSACARAVPARCAQACAQAPLRSLYRRPAMSVAQRACVCVLRPRACTESTTLGASDVVGLHPYLPRARSTCRTPECCARALRATRVSIHDMRVR